MTASRPGVRAEGLDDRLRVLISDWQANGNSRELGDPTASTWHECALQLLRAVDGCDEVAADRWDEGYVQAVMDLCPHTDPELRLLWALDHMPHGNPYRADAEEADDG